MNEYTSCHNCGAVVDPEKNLCAYCGTPYHWAIKRALNFQQEPPQIVMDSRQIAITVQQLDMGLITRTEYRHRLGLPQV